MGIEAWKTKLWISRNDGPWWWFRHQIADWTHIFSCFFHGSARAARLQNGGFCGKSPISWGESTGGGKSSHGESWWKKLQTSGPISASRNGNSTLICQHPLPWIAMNCDHLKVSWWFGILWISIQLGMECHHPNWRTPSFFRRVDIPPTRKSAGKAWIHLGHPFLPPGRRRWSTFARQGGGSKFRQPGCSFSPLCVQNRGKPYNFEWFLSWSSCSL